MRLPEIKPSIELTWSVDRRLSVFQEKQAFSQWSSLYFALRQDRFDQKLLEKGLRLLKEVVLDIRKTPPLGMLLDFIALFEQGEHFSARRLSTSELPFRHLFLRLQNELYHRLVLSPQFQRLRSLWLSLPDENGFDFSGFSTLSIRNQALAYLLGQLFSPVRERLLQPFRPQPLQVFEVGNAPFWWEDAAAAKSYFEELVGMEGWTEEQLELLLTDYLQLSDEELLVPSCEHILRHFEHLQNKWERMRWQQMSQFMIELPPLEDHRYFLRLRDEGYAEMKAQSQNVTPDGGYNGLSNRGYLQSLLPSELIYWEKDTPANQPDLFALRLLEQELLYYERDQNLSYTWRRKLQFVLDLDPGEMNFKADGFPASSISLLLALLARLTADLRMLCPSEVLTIQYYLGPKSKWLEYSSLFRLFFGDLQSVGGFSSFQLIEEPAAFLQENPKQNGTMRLLIASSERWSSYRSSEEKELFEASLCFALNPSHWEEVLEDNPVDYALSMLFMDEESEEVSPEQRIRKNMPLIRLPEQMIWMESDEEAMITYAKLRDLMLEWILKMFSPQEIPSAPNNSERLYLNEQALPNKSQ